MINGTHPVIGRPQPKRVLVLGSGALQIGQAGEFDYSGSQALKALREEGLATVLVNPNVATIQTSNLADVVYFLPVDAHFVRRVIEAEGVDALLLGFGGQTALNCGLELDAVGVLAQHNVRVLGTSIATIRAAEDRQMFVAKMREIDVDVPRSCMATSTAEAIDAARDIGFPVILRAGFSLGGKGSAIVHDERALVAAAERALASGANAQRVQILVEECLLGWKEIEYEVVRDARDNCIAVCNIENVDPMGIHTGESIAVAPSQTLNDREYQLLRDLSVRIARHLGIVGECNVQFTLDPRSGDYRVIEVNPRLSRSSALASKATGYPLAYVAAKIALGYSLPEISNAVTGKTTAFFEPALDYLVCKVPRWDFDKFAGVDQRIGTEMKSVGEVMAIGRTFGEVLQKALRMLEIGAKGLTPSPFVFPDVRHELSQPSPRRIFAIAHALDSGMSVDEVATLTSIDRFFLDEIAEIVLLNRDVLGCTTLGRIDHEGMRSLKRAGFSDAQIAFATSTSQSDARRHRLQLGVLPHLAQIDTLAAEYPARTNYLYLTFGADEHEAPKSSRERVLVLGSGPYRIGSSVEFDWCCVNAVLSARGAGFETVLLNCNPETVSTDYDVTDVLVFDELSLESVLEVVDALRPLGVIVSMGGQTPNNLALALADNGITVLGTSAQSIDIAEDRRKFSALCDEIGVDQPRWAEATALANVEAIVESLGGYPVLVRPSYVLSGAAMRVAHSEPELRSYIGRAVEVSNERPVVISKFEKHAREIEFDAVARNGEIVGWAISEHVEDAGVHSGDSTLLLPPQELYSDTVRRVRRIGTALARALEVTGPFNIQLLARHDDVKVIECNLRASRSFPFVSKVLGANFIHEATLAILGMPPSLADAPNPLDIDYVGVKAPQFSFRRLSGVDPILGVEMASTGEAACFGRDAHEALLKAMIATGFRYPRRGVLLSLGPVDDKYRFTEEALLLGQAGLRLFATAGTADALRAVSIQCEAVDKANGAIERMRAGDIDLVINIPREYDGEGHPDGIRIRRAAIDLEIPLITDLALARRVVRAMSRYQLDELEARPWGDYVTVGPAKPASGN